MSVKCILWVTISSKYNIALHHSPYLKFVNGPEDRVLLNGVRRELEVPFFWSEGMLEVSFPKTPIIAQQCIANMLLCFN